MLVTDFIPTVSRLSPARLLTSYLETKESWAQRTVGPIWEGQDGYVNPDVGNSLARQPASSLALCI